MIKAIALSLALLSAPVVAAEPAPISAVILVSCKHVLAAVFTFPDGRIRSIEVAQMKTPQDAAAFIAILNAAKARFEVTIPCAGETST